MKAIIITDEEAKALVDRIKLEKFETSKHLGNMCEYEKTRPGVGMEQAAQSVLNDMHRHFHYEVVRWLQKMGADLT